jgi:hypothetical protein
MAVFLTPAFRLSGTMPQYVVTLNLELLCAAENNTDDYNEIEC